MGQWERGGGYKEGKRAVFVGGRKEGGGAGTEDIGIGVRR